MARGDGVQRCSAAVTGMRPGGADTAAGPAEGEVCVCGHASLSCADKHFKTDLSQNLDKSVPFLLSLQLLRECVSEHQAYISKLLLTGTQLASLGALEEVTMRQCSCSAEQRYVAVMEKVRGHGRALVEAICQSSQVLPSPHITLQLLSLEL